MREYLVTIETSNHPTTVAIFAKDRDDAIDFVKRNNRARFHRKEYKSIKGAHLKKEERR